MFVRGVMGRRSHAPGHCVWGEGNSLDSVPGSTAPRSRSVWLWLWLWVRGWLPRVALC